MFLISEEDEKPGKKSLDKPDSKRSKRSDDDDDDDEDDRSYLKMKTVMNGMTPKKTKYEKKEKKSDDDDDEENGDVFSKSLAKMKESRVQSNVGVQKTGYYTSSHSPHLAQGKKKTHFM